MRWLSQLLVILIICLAFIPAATPAEAAGAYLSVSPGSGIPGRMVTVYGHNFTHDEWVDVYYYRDSVHETWVAEVMADDDGYFDVDFEVPESHSGPHKVVAEQLVTSATAFFTAEPGLRVSPQDGPVGVAVIVEGRGFAENEDGIELRYYLNGDYEVIAENIEADDDGSWERSFPIPPSAKGSHNLDAKGVSSSLPQVEDASFEVTPGISLDKSLGSPDDSIAATGSGFAVNERDITILFEGEAVQTEIRADETGYWQEDFQVPEMPKGTYSVTAQGEQTSEEDINVLSFDVTPGLVLAPRAGHVGTNLTVAGGGFVVGEDVFLKYCTTYVTTASINSKGSFQATLLVPESQHGGHNVTAEDTAGNNATAVFTMESIPPGRPELESPADGSEAGFVGRVRPTFEWTPVSDDSGVYYSLQIATSDNASAGGGFANPLVSVQNIVGTNYTLKGPEALSYGTYYWIVQAVDGAQNAGQWTAARSFRAGALPLWAFILAIVAFVALAGTLLYHFVIRRRIYYR